MADIDNRQLLLETVQKFCLMDDTFFNCFMADNLEGMQYVLSIILDREDLVVKRLETQHSVPNLYGRGVRFDVFATDSQGHEYDIEVQNANSGATPRRARYNMGMMDYRNLSAGAKVNNLPESYVIFITADDVLGYNKPIYHIERKILETDTDFSDGAHIIYVNGAYDDDSTVLGQMMYDFKRKQADEMKSSVLAARMRVLKETEAGVSKMCEVMEELMKKYGQEKETEGALRMALSMLKKGRLTEDEAAEETGMTVTEFRKAVAAII